MSKIKNTKIIPLIIAGLAVIIGAVIGISAIATLVKRNSDIKEIEKKYPNAIITPSGLRYIVLEESSGPKPIPGRSVLVKYEGSLLSGVVFDSSDIQGHPLEFETGTDQAIKGFEEAVIDMREGEKRLVIIPPELGYGSRSVGNGLIPGNSFIIFEMELYRVR